MKEFRIWFIYTRNAFSQAIINRGAIGFFLFGKLVRIVMFAVFIYFLLADGRTLAGYTQQQVIFFYLTFSLVDSLGQCLFREVYRFKSYVISGELDLILVKPSNPLTRVLLGGADVIDVFINIGLGGVVIWYGWNNISQDPIAWWWYWVLVLNGIVIAAAIHIFILAFGVKTLASDQAIFTYRDMGQMLRIPVNLYTQPIRSLLTYVIPLGIMITFPAQAASGMLSGQLIVVAIGMAILSLTLALWFWRRSLRYYTSASS